MNSLQPPTTSRFAPKHPGYRALWLAWVTWVVASVAGATVAIANVPVGQWSSDLSFSAEAASPQSPDELPRFQSGCQTCGVVENIRKLDATGSTPAGYEFTVRLRDGSTRVSSDASVAKWRVGDPIMLIGGDKPSSNTPASL
jgi:hypothetical protein